MHAHDEEREHHGFGGEHDDEWVTLAKHGRDHRQHELQLERHDGVHAVLHDRRLRVLRPIQRVASVDNTVGARGADGQGEPWPAT